MKLTMCLAVVLHEVPGHSIDLHGQLPGGGDDNGPCAVTGHELGSMQQLQRGNQECQSLAGPCRTMHSKQLKPVLGYLPCFPALCEPVSACNEGQDPNAWCGCSQGCHAEQFRRHGLTHKAVVMLLPSHLLHDL